MADSPVFDFLDDDGCVIPNVPSRLHPSVKDPTTKAEVGGKTYTIPSPEAEMGLLFAALADIGLKVQRGMKVTDAEKAKLKFNDQEEHEFSRDVLGGVYDEMLADGVSWVRMQRITQYVYTYFALGADAANDAAGRGAFSGKAQTVTGNRASRRGTPAQSGRQGSTATRAKRRRR